MVDVTLNYTTTASTVNTGDPINVDIVSEQVNFTIEGGISNHSSLSGLDNDDHTQYYNLSRLNTYMSSLDISTLNNDAGYITSAQAPVQSVNSLTGSVVLNSDNISEGSNNLYDKTVVLTAGTNITVTGSYPNFTINASDQDGAVSSGKGQTGRVI